MLYFIGQRKNVDRQKPVVDRLGEAGLTYHSDYLSSTDCAHLCTAA